MGRVREKVCSESAEGRLGLVMGPNLGHVALKSSGKHAGKSGSMYDVVDVVDAGDGDRRLRRDLLAFAQSGFVSGWCFQQLSFACPGFSQWSHVLFSLLGMIVLMLSGDDILMDEQIR